MARYWLGPWVIYTDLAFPATYYGPPANTQVSLDLRSPIQCASVTPEGDGLFVTANAINLGSDYTNLGTDPDLILSGQQKASWKNRFGLPNNLQAQTLREALYETLTIQADPTGLDRCLPIIPTTNRVFELWLGGIRVLKHRLRASRPEWAPVIDLLKRQYREIRQKTLDGHFPENHYRKVLGYWVKKYLKHYRNFQPADVPDEEPFTPDSQVIDSFNRADGEIGTDYTEDGDIDIVSSAAQHITNGSFGIARARHNTALSSDDHYCEFTSVNGNAIGDAAPATLVRYSTSVNDLYYATFIGNSSSGGPSPLQLWKIVGGSFTQIGSNGPSDIFNNNDTLKILCDGSTIKAYKTDVEKVSTTDTAITGNLNCGMFTYKGSGIAPRIDSLLFADMPLAFPFLGKNKIYQRLLAH